MRIASRVLACVLAFAGILFLFFSVFGLIGGFAHKSVLEQSWPSAKLWAGSLLFAAMGAGLLWGGRYFFTVDPAADDEPEIKPPSRFAPFLVAHRRELKVIAQVGLAVSLIRVGAALFGVTWSRGWANNAVDFSWLTLFFLGTMMQNGSGQSMDWQSCPEHTRAIAKGLFKSAFVMFVLFLAWNMLAHHGRSSGLFSFAYQPFIFAWEILFFSYGRFAVAR